MKKRRKKSDRWLKKAQRRVNRVVVPGAGPPCPRCGCATDVRSHREIGASELRRPFYYSRWYFCANMECQTKTIMPEEFKVFRDGDVPGWQGDVLRKGDDIVMDVLAEMSGGAGLIDED